MNKTSRENLIIIGASGHGKVVADIAIHLKCYKNIAFLDDDDSIKTALGHDVIGPISDVFKYKENSDVFIAIGNNKRREEIQELLEIQGFSIPILVHPQSIVGMEVTIGQGTVIMAGVIVNCSTKIGKGCIINTGASLDHDNVIEDYVHISPGAMLAGTVKIGRASWLGIGSIVRNNINITRNCIIGAGAGVFNDINVAGTYVGIPARRILDR